MYPGPWPINGHGFGAVAGIFGAIIWAVGSLIALAVIVALIVLLARFLWIGTRAAQRYLELNGSPTPGPTAGPPAASPAAAATTTAPATTAPATTAAAATTAATPTKPATKPRTPRTPPKPTA